MIYKLNHCINFLVCIYSQKLYLVNVQSYEYLDDLYNLEFTIAELINEYQS